jgi:GAF domain-containing protein
MSATPDSTLADPERLIADLQRQLAERTAERDAALQRETATAEVLQVINASPGDLVPVFDAMLEKAMRLCEAAFGLLWIYDGERFHVAATKAVPEAFAKFLRDNPQAAPRKSDLGRLLRGEPIIHRTDYADEVASGRGSALRQAFVDLGGGRTGLIVALRKENAVLGALRLYRQEVRPFSDKQIALLQNFAAQAVIAMENARLLTETREALEQQTATAEVLQVINASPGDLAPVWDAMLEKATRLCEAASGILWTYDGSRFRAAAVHGAPEEYVEWLHSLPDPVPSPSLARIASGEKIVRDDDLATAPGTVAYAHTLAGMRTGFLVALRKGDALLGAIRIFRQDPRPFSDKHIVLVENFAAQAVIAMENARLLTETREALEQQTATAEVLQVINSSPGDLAPVFDAMLEKAHRLCGADTGSLQLYEGEISRAVATRGLSEEHANRLRQGFRPGIAHPMNRLLDGADFIQIPDLSEVDDPLMRIGFQVGGIRTYLSVPLRKDGRLLVLLRQ